MMKLNVNFKKISDRRLFQIEKIFERYSKSVENFSVKSQNIDIEKRMRYEYNSRNGIWIENRLIYALSSISHEYIQTHSIEYSNISMPSYDKHKSANNTIQTIIFIILFSSPAWKLQRWNRNSFVFA